MGTYGGTVFTPEVVSWSYQVDAGGTSLSYSLSNAPAGMAVSNSGLVIAL